MKRITFISLAVLLGLFANAQTEFDALKFVQPDIYGTARYSSMAGAFGALGGDPSAFRDNPAGLGIYRKSELATTIDYNVQRSRSSWTSNVSVEESFNKFGFNQLSYVLSVPAYSSSSNLKYSNFAFSYNRLKSLDRSVRINGGNGVTYSITDYVAYFTGDTHPDDLYEVSGYNPYNNTSVSWLSALFANAGLIEKDTGSAFWKSILFADETELETVAPSYRLRERGYLHEYAFSWSGNFNNKFYLGATINIHDMSYALKSEYKETFSSDNGYVNLINTFESNAYGVGFKIGGIYVPLDFLRLGASLQTPIAYNIKDYFYADLNSGFDTDNGFINQRDGSPQGNSSFKIRGPFTYNASAALILGNVGLLSFEYAGNQNSLVKFMDTSNDSFDFDAENDGVKSYFNTIHTFKLGGEYRLNNNFALRIGGAIMTPATKEDLGKMFYPNTIRTDVDYFVQDGNTTYLSGGFGYRATDWFLDFAVINKSYSQKFYPFNTFDFDTGDNYKPATVNTNSLNVVATLGFRF